MDQSLISVMKSIGNALQLDSSSDYQQAYIKYAECILNIVSNLLHKVKTDGDRVIVSKEVVRHVQLGQQCMERLVALVQKLESIQNAASSRATSLQISSNMAARGQGRDQLAKRFSEPVPPLQSDTSPYAFSRKHGPSPMELAYMRNQQIMSAYKSRLARMNKGSQATLSLTIQRKMAENLAIAKAQELALSKKMNERQNRLEEQAKRRFSAPMGMSEEEQEQRQIYKKILEYEQDAKWLSNWRFKLEESPEDPIVINQLIQEILRCSDHPLTQLLKKYQFKVYERLYPLVSRKQSLLKDIRVPLPLYLFPSDAQIEGREMEEPTVTGEREKEQPEDRDIQTEKSTNDGQGNSDGEIAENESDFETSSLERKKKEKKENDNSEKENEYDTENDIHDVSADKEHSKGVSVEIKCYQIDEDEDKETSDIINEVVNEDSPERDSGEDGSSFKTMDDIVEETKENVEKALDQGKKLEKELTIENKKADSIVKQICEYEKYNEENMDDLFEDDDFEDGESDQKASSSKERPESFHSLPSMRKTPEDLPKRSTSFEHNITEDSKPFPKSQSMDCGSTSLPPESSLKSSSSLHSLESPDGELSKMSEEAHRRHLEGIIHDVHGYLEKLQLMFVIAYEKLDSPTGRDQCYASLEEPFFKSIWKYILSLFRLVNRRSERTLAYKMTTQRDSDPSDFMVNKKLWLVSADGENSLPYNKAVLELKKVKEYYTMLSKLECVVRVCREVCSCVEDHYTKGGDSSGRKTPPSVGADDLLPILSFIIIKSELPQLVSECQAMAEFIHEGYIMGEEGYCLTSLQTAINFLTSEDSSI